MKHDGISRTQLMALLWAGVMAPAAELFPGLLLEQAGKASWLAVVLAAPLVLAAGWMFNALAGDQGLSRALVTLLGGWAGHGVILLYMVWAELLLVLRLQSCARRLLASGNRDGAQWFFLITVAGLLLWMGRGKLAAFARAGQIFLAALLAASVVILGLSLPQARAERILPIWLDDSLMAAGAAPAAAGVIGWGLFTAFLLGKVKDQGEEKGWHWIFWGLGGTVLLAAAQIVILGNLGVGLAMKLENPFFALAKSVGVEGAFQRVESMISALWTFADLAMGGILVFAIREMGEEVISSKRKLWLPWVSVILAALCGLALFPGDRKAAWLNESVVPFGNIVLAVILPAVLCLVKATKEVWKRKGHIL